MGVGRVARAPRAVGDHGCAALGHDRWYRCCLQLCDARSEARKHRWLARGEIVILTRVRVDVEEAGCCHALALIGDGGLLSQVATERVRCVRRLPGRRMPTRFVGGVHRAELQQLPAP